MVNDMAKQYLKMKPVLVYCFGIICKCGWQINASITAINLLGDTLLHCKLNTRHSLVFILSINLVVGPEENVFLCQIFQNEFFLLYSTGTFSYMLSANEQSYGYEAISGDPSGNV